MSSNNTTAHWATACQQCSVSQSADWCPAAPTQWLVQCHTRLPTQPPPLADSAQFYSLPHDVTEHGTAFLIGSGQLSWLHPAPCCHSIKAAALPLWVAWPGCRHAPITQQQPKHQCGVNAVLAETKYPPLIPYHLHDVQVLHFLIHANYSTQILFL